MGEGKNPAGLKVLGRLLGLAMLLGAAGMGRTIVDSLAGGRPDRLAFFDEPEDFRPERWLDGLAKRLPRFAYFPFGGGPRLCIGQSFAMLESVLILSTIAQEWRLRAASDEPVELSPALTLRPKHGVRMQIGRRQH